MSRCLRICGAYSYRLTRRHSTIFLIISFIVILSIIFQFYAYKHQDFPHFSSRVGDFEYRPGAFLKGQQPNENISYCQFNYGLPDEIKWENLQIITSPENGRESTYRVIYNAIKGNAYENYSKYNAVTYATQATPEFIYHIVEIARYWDGPISFAVFVPNYDMDIAINIMNQLCRCYSAMSKVSLHLFYPKKFPPKIYKHDPVGVTTDFFTSTQDISEIQIEKLAKFRSLNNKTRANYILWARKRKIARMMSIMSIHKAPPKLLFTDCSGLEIFDVLTFRRENKIMYPINIGRNVARNASWTNYFIVSDIELVPSYGLAPKFLAMLRKLMGDKKRDKGCIFSKTVFVVPLFEVDRGLDIPRDKDTLVHLIKEKRARYFHQKVCPHCQRFPGLQSWIHRPSPTDIEPMMIAKREYPYHRWEPLYFGTHQEPLYSEMLSWEGKQDKMAQMLEMCILQYKLVILDGGFLCHYHRSIFLNLTPNLHQRNQRLNTYRYRQLKLSYQNYYRSERVINHKCREMLEMCLQEYRMVVLDGAFMCHAAVPRTGSPRNRAVWINHRRYHNIVSSFVKKYPNPNQKRSKCNVMYGC